MQSWKTNSACSFYTMICMERFSALFKLKCNLIFSIHINCFLSLKRWGLSFVFLYFQIYINENLGFSHFTIRISYKPLINCFLLLTYKQFNAFCVYVCMKVVIFADRMHKSYKRVKICLSMITSIIARIKKPKKAFYSND